MLTHILIMIQIWIILIWNFSKLIKYRPTWIYNWNIILRIQNISCIFLFIITPILLLGKQMMRIIVLIIICFLTLSIFAYTFVIFKINLTIIQQSFNTLAHCRLGVIDLLSSLINISAFILSDVNNSRRIIRCLAGYMFDVVNIVIISWW